MHGILHWSLVVLIIRNMIYGALNLEEDAIFTPYFTAVLLMQGIGHAYFVASRCPTLKQQWKDFIKKWKCPENEVNPSAPVATIVERNTGQYHDHFQILERMWNATTPTKASRYACR